MHSSSNAHGFVVPASLRVANGLCLVPFRDRIKAAAIDAALVSFTISGLVLALFLLSGQFPDEEPAWYSTASLAVCLVVPWLYFAGLEAAPTQGTVGMLYANARVATALGERIGFLRATIRFAFMALAFVVFPVLIISALIACQFERAQAIHDMIAKTLVVRRSIPSP